MMGACLANNGVNPVTGVVALQPRYVEKVLSVMSTCGMYDYSGAWIFDVGMPAKSGVGGGIMAVLPGQFGLGVFSPALDEKGNSVRGIEACRRLSNDFSLHLFNVARSTSASILRKVFDSTTFASRKRRSPAERSVLSSEGQRIRIYELQGELLFGNTESVALDMLSALSEVDFIVVDLKRVIAMDRASILLLSEVCHRTAEQDKRLLFTNCAQLYRFKKHLRTLDEPTQAPGWLAFDDTDHALEWCENQLIDAAQIAIPKDEDAADLCQHYLCADLTDAEQEALRNGGNEQQFTAGSHIVRKGDPANSMFFILSGQVEVLVDTEAGDQLRLTTLGPGNSFGEIALVNQGQRTANVVAANETVCLEVDFSGLQDPVRTKMLANMAGYLASRLEQNTELMQHMG